MMDLLHDPTACTRIPCGKCAKRREANPPNPVDHNVAARRKASGREVALGRLLQELGRRIEAEGETAGERFAQWQRTREIPRDSNRGGGNGGVVYEDARIDRREDQYAAALRDRWLRCNTKLLALAGEAEWLLDAAKVTKALGKDRSAAQAAADGWCISCFRDDQHLTPIGLRPTGEPYYRDRCRGCGEWRASTGEDPPLEVLRTRHRGGRVRVRA